MRIICTSTIRCTSPGDVHGQVYVVDIFSGEVDIVYHHDYKKISWDGPGGARGLRGVEVIGDEIYAVSDTQLLEFDRSFNLVGKYTTSVLKYAHEIFFASDGLLYIVLTDYTSLLTFDPTEKEFVNVYLLKYDNQTYEEQSISKKINTWDQFHLNNVFEYEKELYVSGLGYHSPQYLYKMEKGKLIPYMELPQGTHNARPFLDGVLYNNSKLGETIYQHKKEKLYFTTPIHKVFSELNTKQARKPWTRGLAVHDDFVITGSAPASINVHCWGTAAPLKIIPISNNVANSIHGLRILEV